MSLQSIAYEPVSGKINVGYRHNSLKPLSAEFGGTGSNTGVVKTSSTTYSVTMTPTANTSLTLPTSGTLLAAAGAVSTSISVVPAADAPITVPIIYVKQGKIATVYMNTITHTMASSGPFIADIPNAILPGTAMSGIFLVYGIVSTIVFASPSPTPQALILQVNQSGATNQFVWSTLSGGGFTAGDTITVYFTTINYIMS